MISKISYFPMGCPDHEKPHSMSFSLCRNLYASINFPLKYNPNDSVNKIENFMNGKTY